MSHPLSDMMGTTMEKIRSMVDVNSVIGDPIVLPDGVTILPISKVSCGFGSGGSDYVSKHPSVSGQNPFGGGAGAGVTVQPVSFLIVKGDSVRMLPVAAPVGNSLDRIIEMLPDLVDKLSDLLKKDKKEEEDVSEF